MKLSFFSILFAAAPTSSESSDESALSTDHFLRLMEEVWRFTAL